MLSLTQEQEMLVQAANELAEAEFSDQAFEWEGGTPWENFQTLADHGFMGINFPEEYGGGGMGEFEAMLLVEAVGRVCPDTAIRVMNQHLVAPRAIDMFGSAALKEQYLPPVAAGDSLIAVAISEPQAGSDVKAMETSVREEDGDLLLSGEKIWVSEYPEADAAVVWAKFPEGLGSVVLDLDDPDVEVSEHFTNMFGGKQTQFFMNDVVLPPENVLVRGSESFRSQLKALNWERVGSSILNIAMARCAIEKARTYAKDRVQFDQPIAEFQGIRWKLADMVTDLQCARSMVYTAAEQGQATGSPERLQTSIAKLVSAEMVDDVIDEALQIHGANGYQQGHPIEYLYRMARGRRLAGGTDEILRNTIAQAVLQDGVPDIAG